MNSDLVKLAFERAPDVMQKTASVLAELEQKDKTSFQDTLKDLVEIITHASERAKTAGVGQFMGNLGKDVAKGLTATVATALGVAVATDMYHRAKSGLSSGSNWRAMITANPHLKDKPIGQVRQAFNMLQRHAPDVAADPLAAGALVNNVVELGETPGVMHKQLTEMVELQKKKTDALYRPFDKLVKVPPVWEKDERPKSGGAKG